MRVTFTADSEPMFHILVVREPYRNFLRFLWYKDSNTTREVVEYRMKFHGGWWRCKAGTYMLMMTHVTAICN